MAKNAPKGHGVALAPFAAAARRVPRMANISDLLDRLYPLLVDGASVLLSVPPSAHERRRAYQTVVSQFA
jgi:hypothetical protein